MGRYSNSGQAHGTSGSPQISLGFASLADKIEELSEERLIKELVDRSIKFTRENIVFIKRDEVGQPVWLETGNESAGLKHIIKEHSQDFKNATNINEDEIPSIISQSITKENFVNKKERIGKSGKKEIRKLYKYNGKYYVAISFGDNGFIVSAHPKKV